MIYQQKPTIKCSDEVKARLDKLKIIEQEPYESVIVRLIDLKVQFDKRFKEVKL